MFASVIVDVKNSFVNKTYDYKVPTCFEDVIEIGMRVNVPFGSRYILGFVVDIKENCLQDEEKLKEIKDILDIEPVLNKELVELAKYISNTYYSFLISSFLLMIPSALRVKYQKNIVKMSFDIDHNIAFLFENKNKIEYTDALSKFMPIIYQEVKNGNLAFETVLSDKYQIKYQKIIKLNNHYDYKLTEKQKKIVEFLEEYQDSILKLELIENYGYSKNIIDLLVEKGVLKEEKEEVYRNIPHIYKSSYTRVSLNELQKSVYEEINQFYGTNKKFLLHGITGSGKTEIYMKVIEDNLALGKSSIMLVPEISLTPQIVSQFRIRFGDNVAVLHSALSSGERYDEYRKIKMGLCKVVVGARSAIFAPVQNLGLIIIDEAHETTYKQDSNPKYNAIEIAKWRAKYHNCLLILGSATPSIKTYYEALHGEYELLSIDKRYNNMPLPSVEVVDMKEELKRGNRSILSRRLSSLIEEKLSRHEQIILLLNRRGYSSFVLCRDCGITINCPHCSTTLTYHKYSNTLKCHYCGYETPNVDTCPECKSKNIRYVGLGTQKVEEYINSTYPYAKSIRMDNDTTRNKGSHEIILEKFRNKEADILIGTQMIAKGLDFKDVTLVGILMADYSLKMPFYDAFEQTYSLIEQVSGRAGRGDVLGNVIVQAYDTENYALESAKNHDYKGFFFKEIKNRQVAKYPPFVKMVEITITSSDLKLLNQEAKQIANYFKKLDANLEVFGPVEPFIYKTEDRYHLLVNVKYPLDYNIDKPISFIISNYFDDKNISIDVDKK